MSGCLQALRLIAFCSLFVLPPTFVSAEERSIKELVAVARNGELSLEELAEAIANSVEADSTQALTTQIEDLPFPGYEETVADALFLRAESVFLEKSTEEVSGLLLLAKKLLSSENPKRQKLQELFDFVITVETIEQSDEVDVARLYAIRTETEAQQNILQSRLRGVIKDYAAAIVSEEPALTAATELATLSKQWGVEAVLPSIPALLPKLAALNAEQLLSNPFALSESLVDEFLSEATLQDSSVQPVLLGIHQRRAVAGLEEQNVEAAQSSYQWVLSKRPDPNASNEEFRRSLVFADSSSETQEFRDSLLGELKQTNSVGTADTIRLQARDSKGIIFGVLGVVIAFFGFVFYRSRQPGGAKRREKTRAEKKAAKRGVGYMNVTDGDDEYTELLSVFGLAEDASESEIKKAYRDAVKKAHPDVAAGGGEPDEELFQETKRVYDRIMQIRGSWFGT